MILHADCIEAMREMDEASVDAICTDPPYGLEFMGKDWDSLASGAAVVADPASVGGYQDPGGGNAYSKARIRYGQGEGTGRAMQDWHHAWATEALRVLKPGGHLLAFGGTRTYHRLACAIEDAGFEIRDCLCWLYGSGFPKSLDVSKAIDRAAGAKREVVGSKIGQPGYSLAEDQGPGGVAMEGNVDGSLRDAEAECAVTAPATPEAAQWQGWGTALKPAHEPIVLARKPLVGTVSRNVQEFGTGALNVDGCRVEGVKPVMERTETVVAAKSMAGESTGATSTGEVTTEGRWPANVALSHLDECEAVGTRRVKTGTAVKRHGVSSEGVTGWGKAPPGTPDVTHADEDGLETVERWECAPGCPVAMLDEQSGSLTSGKLESHHADNGKATGTFGAFEGAPGRESYGDSGGASRFFPTFKPDQVRFAYVPKSSRAERNAGLGDGGEYDHSGPRGHRLNGDGTPRPRPRPRPNSHPTVKPISLMRWLVRLVTPPGGRVLDPFAGSGTTGCAAVLEGFDFIGIEREAEYVAIAEARIAWWSEHQGREAEEVLADSRRSEVEREKHEASGQMELMEPAA